MEVDVRLSDETRHYFSDVEYFLFRNDGVNGWIKIKKNDGEHVIFPNVCTIETLDC